MEDAGLCGSPAARSKRKIGDQELRYGYGKGICSRICLQQQLAAENLNGVLDSMIKFSEGNPGAILRMIAMAKQSKYRSDDHIKWSPLYIDFLMEWAAAKAV